MKEDAPILHPDIRTSGTPEKSDKQTNVASQVRFARGDLEAGFKAADVVVEREFDTSMVHQGYIEPHNAVAQYNADGHSHAVDKHARNIYCPRPMRPRARQIPASSIKVVPAEIGGGFGGKIGIYLEPLALLLSKKTGKPVKLVMSRGEVLRRPVRRLVRISASRWARTKKEKSPRRKFGWRMRLVPSLARQLAQAV